MTLAAADNDIVLQGILVEVYHCSLERRLGNWHLIDLSQNGTIAHSCRLGCDRTAVIAR